MIVTPARSVGMLATVPRWLNVGHLRAQTCIGQQLPSIRPMQHNSEWRRWAQANNVAVPSMNKTEGDLTLSSRRAAKMVS